MILYDTSSEDFIMDAHCFLFVDRAVDLGDLGGGGRERGGGFRIRLARGYVLA